MDRDLDDRLFKFALSVLKMLGKLNGGKEIEVIKYQLSKSATSVGANYQEAQASISRPEFRMKILISLKEMRETNYRLRILDSLFPESEEIKTLFRESTELKLILGKIATKTIPTP